MEGGFVRWCRLGWILRVWRDSKTLNDCYAIEISETKATSTNPLTYGTYYLNHRTIIWIIAISDPLKLIS